MLRTGFAGALVISVQVRVVEAALAFNGEGCSAPVAPSASKFLESAHIPRRHLRWRSSRDRCADRVGERGVVDGQDGGRDLSQARATRFSHENTYDNAASLELERDREDRQAVEPGEDQPHIG